MFCPNCGTNNPDGSKFCSECGTVFESVKAPEADTPAPTVDEILGEIKSEPVAQPAPAEPEQPAPAEPEQPAPVEPEQPAPAEPEQPVPVELAKPVSEPAQPVEQAQPAPEQPAVSSIPVQPAVEQVQPVPQPPQPAAPQMPQQPAQPQMYAPAYPQQPAAPKPPKPPRKPLDAKQKKLLIIGGSCGAVLVAFLIVLFTAIIPHAGLKGKLRYSWTRVDRSSTNVLNLKKKTWTVGTKTYKIKSWKTSGDRVQFNYTEDGLNLETETFVVAFSPDGKKVYFFDAYGYDDGDRPDYVFARGNYVQNNLSDLLW